MSLATGLFPTSRKSALAYGWRGEDLSLTARSGQVGTLGRTSLGTLYDVNGAVVSAPNNQPRFGYSGSSLGLLLEGLGGNLVLQSETLQNASWTKSGTGSVVDGADTSSGVALALVTDSDAATAYDVIQPVTLTGNTAKAVSCFIRQGTSTQPAIIVRDTTAAAFRLVATVAWSGGVPTVSCSTGSLLRSPTQAAPGVYRVELLTTVVTAANTNQLWLRPENITAVATGSCYFGGAMVQDASFCSSYSKTTTAAFSRGADTFSAAVNLTPQAMSVYWKGITLSRYSSTASVSTYPLILSNAAGAAPYFAICHDPAPAGGWRVYHHNGSASINTAFIGASAVAGDQVEVRGLLNDDGSILCGVSINGGAESTAINATVNTRAAAWSQAQALYLNGYGATPSGPDFALLQAARIAAAASRTMQWLREAA
jgi:hypothetical protein